MNRLNTLKTSELNYSMTLLLVVYDNKHCTISLKLHFENAELGPRDNCCDNLTPFKAKQWSPVRLQLNIASKLHFDTEKET